MNTDELIQIYDDNGDPSSISTKSSAIEQGLRRGIARVFIIDSDGLVCIQKRADTMEIAPGLYDQSAGGHIDAGELPNTAALRELGEELDIHVDKLEFIESYPFEEPYNGSTIFSYDFLYFGRVANDIFHPQKEEVSSVRWVSFQELKNEISLYPEKFAPGFHASFPKFLNRIF